MIVRIISGEQTYDCRVLSSSPLEELFKFAKDQIPRKPESFYFAELDQHQLPVRETSNSRLKIFLEKKKLVVLMLIDRSIDCSMLRNHLHADPELIARIQTKQFAGIIAEIDKIQARPADQNLSEDRVKNFFIGLTGSGKSSIINICQGIQLKCNRVMNEFHLEPAPREDQADKQIAKIGNSRQSSTEAPRLYNSGYNLESYYDMAGLMDTCGLKKDLLNSYINSLVFKEQSLIRLIVTVQETDFDSRGIQLIRIVNRVEKMFPYQLSKLDPSDTLDKLMYCTVIIVTKCSQLSKEEVCQIIEDIAKDAKFNNSLSPEGIKFLEVVVSLDHVLIFPKPIKNQKGGYVLQQPQRIPKFIQNVGICELKYAAKSSLSEQAKLKYECVLNNLQNEIGFMIEQLAYNLPQKSIDQTSIQYYRTVSEVIDKVDSIKIFPFKIDVIRQICEDLKVKFNIDSYIQRIGYLISSLTKLLKLHIGYELKQTLFDTLLKELSRKRRQCQQEITIQNNQQIIIATAEEQIRVENELSERIMLEYRQQAKRIKSREIGLDRELKIENQKLQRKLQNMQKAHDENIHKFRR